MFYILFGLLQITGYLPVYVNYRSVAHKSRSFPTVHVASVEIDRDLSASAQRMSERTKECGKWRSLQESFVLVVWPVAIRICRPMYLLIAIFSAVGSGSSTVRTFDARCSIEFKIWKVFDIRVRKILGFEKFIVLGVGFENFLGFEFNIWFFLIRSGFGFEHFLDSGSDLNWRTQP